MIHVNFAFMELPPAGGEREERPRAAKSYGDAPRNDGPRRGPKSEPYKGGAPKGGNRSNASNAGGGGGGFDIGSGSGGPPPFAKKQYTKKPRK